MARSKGSDWITQICETVEERARAQGVTGPIVCASGISPSGEIHLGNVRELITVHLVAEELAARGNQVRHIHSWDDYDRFRKVPAGLPADYDRFIGYPLSEIPDHLGEYASYAERHMGEFERHMAMMGIQPEYIRQSVAYKRGDYVAKIEHAMNERFALFEILAQYQTEERQTVPREERRQRYYPFRVYCHACHRDGTRVTGWEPDTATVRYQCNQCGHEHAYSLRDEVSGKLVWKVDWPMRWAYENVLFEPGGDDHASPGSSFTVGKQIVKKVFGSEPPHFVGYAFVGVSGNETKISSSAGTAATPRVALRILEPAMLRWLYIRRKPKQRFDIDFGSGMTRLYDEWDRFVDKASRPDAPEVDSKTYQRCIETSAHTMKTASLRIPFRLLSSAADITQGAVDQILRIVREHHADDRSDAALAEAMEPRLDCAIYWATHVLPEAERTIVREAFCAEAWQALPEQTRAAVGMLLERLDEAWSLEGLTRLVYGIPKLSVGADMDAAPTDEIKKAQREFFVGLYKLLCSSDTGPRLPTLLLSIGRERTRALLTAPA